MFNSRFLKGKWRRRVRWDVAGIELGNTYTAGWGERLENRFFGSIIGKLAFFGSYGFEKRLVCSNMPFYRMCMSTDLYREPEYMKY